MSGFFVPLESLKDFNFNELTKIFVANKTQTKTNKKIRK